MSIENNWISVEDRLPDHNREVFVYDAREETVKTDYYIKDRAGEGWAGSFQNRITHWMEKDIMPKPPRKSRTDINVFDLSSVAKNRKDLNH